jgi:hypothetical protein
MEIRRQAETHNPGWVTGAPPVRNQVRMVMVRLETLASGLLRVSTPQARGWAVTVHTRDELARAVAQAFTEAQLASYAAWKGEAYDLDAMTEVDESSPLTAATRTRDFSVRARSDVHNPDDWTPLSDGRWRSPGGRVYGPDTDAVRKVLAKRHRRSRSGRDPHL